MNNRIKIKKEVEEEMTGRQFICTIETIMISVHVPQPKAKVTHHQAM